jgi:hypothetical protein
VSIVITNNTASNPSLGYGGARFGHGVTPLPPSHFYPGGSSIPVSLPLSRLCPEQIIGLVPVFQCTNDECREYLADSLSDDHQYPLPVFADLTDTDPYKNDTNWWLFNPPATGPFTTIVFYLDKKINGSWVQQATLNNNTYGTYYDHTTLQCDYVPWLGYKITWRSVLSAFGEGIYRFRLQSVIYFQTSCCASPPFCLKAFDCIAADRTVRWEASYAGGKFGSIDKDCYAWSFCCCSVTSITYGSPGTTGAIVPCTPINWSDSIRLEGFFGFEKTSYERTKLKYVTGEIKKVRDEALQRFTWKSGNLPKWAHDRLKAYGLMADRLYVSDYNINNADYDIKQKWVVCDSGYEPAHKGYSRYSKVDVDFVEGCQYVFRNRCC